MNSHDPVPNFYLYGEPHRSVEEHFLHVESLDVRSRPAGWTIRPHAHRELNHLILITTGGGAMQAEGAVTEFEAPCLLLIPSQVVHGFHWQKESDGSVITLADSYRDDAGQEGPRRGAACSSRRPPCPLPRMARAGVRQARSLKRELAWIAPGHRTAVDAALALIVVQAVRALAVHRHEGAQSRGRPAELVARFRALVEDRFRMREPIATYAAELGVSPTTLRTACALVAGTPPAEILNLRAFLEAERSLCYSNQTIAEIAYGLGFVDPAYFTRAFTRHAGRSPRQFRIDHEMGRPDPGIAAGGGRGPAPGRFGRETRPHRTRQTCRLRLRRFLNPAGRSGPEKSSCRSSRAAAEDRRRRDSGARLPPAGSRRNRPGRACGLRRNQAGPSRRGRSRTPARRRAAAPR
jgi:AraC family transcriptional activator of pobA